ncbi:GNAT family N-acetyltransferase [Nonomuraea sediminis]|uniref:GNAT family N-acetyltransferase n=1 Tax=Nonomuraea sediminis TaxID=2835864 RepID=UPI001BDCD0D5|nr:GNAT family N-acetyltransferase [Nonomuraea sediminis]
MIRPATPDDVPAIRGLITDLAAYEREAHQVRVTEDQLAGALFGPQAVAGCHLAEVEDGRVAGFAFWYVTFSTWTGLRTLFLEDLFVRPEHRGSGFGRDLLKALAALAVERGYGRFEWQVLDWNSPSRDFYRAIGARELPEWVPCRLDGEALERFAKS